MKNQFADFLPKEKKPSKYGNLKTVYNGVKYDSRAEADYAQFLDLAKHAKDQKLRPLGIERQIKFPVSINGIHICDYIADFRVAYHDRIETIDVKGFKTDIYKLKKKLVEAFYGIKIKEINTRKQ